MVDQDLNNTVNPEKLKYIRLRMYKFSKEALGLSERIAQISAYNAVMAVAGIENEGNEIDKAENIRLSVYEFCKETLGLSEKEAKSRAQEVALCNDMLILGPGVRVFTCSLPFRHPLTQDHEDDQGTKRWRDSFYGQQVTFSKR